MSLSPSVWGEPAWIFLHSITFGYPECPTRKNKEDMRKFFNNIGNVLPCDNCKYNFFKNCRECPLTNDYLDSRESLVKWLLKIHNLVNKETGNPQVTYQELVDKYTEMYKPKESNIATYICIFIILLLTIIISYRFIGNTF